MASALEALVMLTCLEAEDNCFGIPGLLVILESLRGSKNLVALNLKQNMDKYEDKHKEPKDIKQVFDVVTHLKQLTGLANLFLTGNVFSHLSGTVGRKLDHALSSLNNATVRAACKDMLPVVKSSEKGHFLRGAHILQRDPEKMFELMKQIGSGSYGTVHQARNLRTGKLAAVKMIVLEDGEDFTDVENEIQILEECHHDNIVAYYGSFMKDKTLWITMEFCGGGAVSDIYNNQQRALAEPEIACIMYYSLKGLEYLHKSHNVHRDVKGGNILLNDRGEVKLANIGVSTSRKFEFAKGKSCIGTPYWMAPEIIAGPSMGPDGLTTIATPS
eukprot:gene32277-11720_t